MAEYVWSTFRSKAIDVFGSLPSAEQDEQVMEAFMSKPKLVIMEFDRIATAYAQGRIRSGWGVLRKQLSTLESLGDAVVTDHSEREEAQRVGERWLENAGLYIDRPEEVWEELQRMRSLRPYANDEALKMLLLARWQALRLRGEQSEQESEDRAAAYISAHQRARGRKG